MHLRPRVGEEVLDFGGGVGRVEADGDGTDRHGGDVEDHPFGPVFGMDRHPVAHFDAEGEQAVGGVEDGLPVLLPGDLLPDPVVLLPEGHMVGETLGPVAHVAGDGGETRTDVRGFWTFDDRRHFDLLQAATAETLEASDPPSHKNREKMERTCRRFGDGGRRREGSRWAVTNR